jgi:hypothetical protein
MSEAPHLTPDSFKGWWTGKRQDILIMSEFEVRECSQLVEKLMSSGFRRDRRQLDRKN